MSQVTLTSEFALLVGSSATAGPTCEWLTLNAMKSAFAPFDERIALIDTGDQARLRPSSGPRGRASPGAMTPSAVIGTLASVV